MGREAGREGGREGGREDRIGCGQEEGKGEWERGRKVEEL